MVPAAQGYDLQVTFQGGAVRTLPVRTPSRVVLTAPAPAVDAQVLHRLVDALDARA
ncbi:hypothetical protein CLV92_10999 [Kineococcus xinjiangensis]|uniref:Uncharacterized protein n=2 Tax=Kineococcus xinjiangensis TaxID=512762 RepID=A0A2S6IHX3_9ACTN|nr:hypothetical protein CLV92_10999 [Kineococcus xinjiangensis]